MRIVLVLILCSFCFGGHASTVTDKDTLNFDKHYRDSVYRRVIKDGTSRMSCYFSYPAGGSQIQKGYGNNAFELEKLDRFVRSSFSDTLIYVRKILLTGYCSIEGSYIVNDQLARDRANGFRNYLNFEYSLSKRYPVDVHYIGEDWDKLRELVDASDLPEREEVLMIIDQIDVFKGREKKLMDLNGGVPYRTMMKDLFPLLRRVEIVVEYDLHRIIEERFRRKLTDAEFNELLARERAEAEAEERRVNESKLKMEQAERQRLADEKQKKDSELQQKENERKQKEEEEIRRQETLLNERRNQREAERQRQEKLRLLREEERRQMKEERRELRRENNLLIPLVSIKTNLYSWAGMTPELKLATFTPNLSAEAFFAKRWSVSASAAYVNWGYDNDRQYWGLSAYSIEPRFWLNGDGRYRWCYIGVFGQTGDFDNRSTDAKRIKENNANCTGTYWQAGVSVGCYILLNAHWGLEVGARGGYRSWDAKAYDVIDTDHYYNHDVKGNRFCLTGINIGISYRFGKNK